MKLAVAAVAAVIVLTLGTFAWLLNDLRLELKRSAAIVNRDLPVILTNTRRTTETLAEVGRDIKDLRDLAGVQETPRDRTLVTFADGMLDLLEMQSGATIGTEKLIGSALSDPLPAADWVAGARKEAVWLSFRARSRRELLDRLTANRYGIPWRIQEGDAPPVPLRDWLVEHHPPANEAAAQEEGAAPAAEE
jgi:hypothetical protein